MTSIRTFAALALTITVTSPLLAQEDPGLALPRTARTPAATPRGPAAGTNRRVDLRGSWTGEQTDAPSKEAAAPAPGNFRFSRTRREPNRDTYAIRIVANATDSTLQSAEVAATFDGTRLTITWAPSAGVAGRLGIMGTPTTPPAPRTIVYAHSADDDFDRLTKTSGDELPNGVPAPAELRRLKPPQVEFPAEYEPSDEILWGYQDAYAVSLIYVAAVRGCAANGETAKHRFYASSEADEQQVRYELAEAVGPAVMRRLVLFRRVSFETIWMRDYGPWTVRTKRGHQRVIGDMGYYEDRPNDDRLPVDYANLRGWRRLDLSSLKIEGGNIMSDGHGKLFTTNRTLEGGGEMGANDEQDDVEASLRRVGASEVHFFERMPEPEGTGHIDMFSKLMDDRTVLVGNHHDPVSRAVLDRNAAKFSALGYRVARVDFARPDHVTDVGRHGLPLMTYTNSLFVGRTALVTQYSDAEKDRAAMETYRRLGWKPIGIDVRTVISANGAIHCITMQVPAR